MGGSEPEGVASQFIIDNIALLLSHYSLAYINNGGAMEYIITDRQSGEDISFSIMLSHNTFSHKIHVCKFYPGLYRQADSRYLSAASFFLFVHHFGQKLKIHDNYLVFLQSRQAVFNDFYSKLKDFKFKIVRKGQGENVDVASPYLPVKVDDSVFIRRSDGFYQE